MTAERLQKILARAGLGSRRDCDEMIAQGLVTVNGETALPGQQADATRDQIRVNGARLPKQEPLVYIALNKPRGVISSREAQDERQTVTELVGAVERLYPVGRLDADSEGLVLLTNDGPLANLLTHPRYGHEKEYRVLVARDPDEKRLQAWRRGVQMDDGWKSAPAGVEVEKKADKGTWLRVTMKEGRKHQIRDIGLHLGLPVLRIVRVRLGTLKLGDLRPGKFRELAEWEVERLKGKESNSKLQNSNLKRKA